MRCWVVYFNTLSQHSTGEITMSRTRVPVSEAIEQLQQLLEALSTVEVIILALWLGAMALCRVVDSLSFHLLSRLRESISVDSEDEGLSGEIAGSGSASSDDIPARVTVHARTGDQGMSSRTVLNRRRQGRRVVVDQLRQSSDSAGQQVSQNLGDGFPLSCELVTGDQFRPVRKFYAVRKGRCPGIYTSWAECESQVTGYSGAVHKSFKTEIEARRFVGL